MPSSPIDLSRFDQLKISGDLPSPKGVALAIMQFTQREDASIEDLAHIVRADPAFVGRLIKSANSVLSGRRPVVSIRDALSALGMVAVRNLALGFSLLSEYRSGACAAFDYQAFWSEALARAVAMQRLAARIHSIAPEEAFSIGLLARIGDLTLATLYPQHYTDVLKAVRNGADTLLALEREAFAVDHREVTVAMMADWGVPRIFTDPVLCHELAESMELPEGSRHYNLAHSLGLAQVIAELCLADDSMRGAVVSRLYRVGEWLSLGPSVISPLCDQVVREWQEWGAMLKVETRAVPSLEELTAHLVGDGEGAKVGDGNAMRILVAEPDGSQLATLRNVLEGEGHTVFHAATGPEALEKALELQPDMLIVDWLLPDMSGAEVARTLRETKIGRAIYVLLATAADDEDRLTAAYDAGADGCLVKPYRPRLLASRLRSAQRVVRLHREIDRDREEIKHFAADLSVTNRRLQEAAMTDSLTGFPNRRYAMEQLQMAWSAARRSHRPLAMMMIDADGFKQVNDTHGHDVGDAVLKQTAHALKDGLRIPDVICRIGGDEFLVICPDTDLTAALGVAERLRRAVEATPIYTGNLRLQTSASLGVAQLDTSMKGPEDLLKMADKAVYIAKQNGRNCVASVQAWAAEPAA